MWAEIAAVLPALGVSTVVGLVALAIWGMQRSSSADRRELAAERRASKEQRAELDAERDARRDAEDRAARLARQVERLQERVDDLGAELRELRARLEAL